MTPGVVVMISFILIAILGVATWGGARLFRSYRAGHAAVFSAFLRIVFLGWLWLFVVFFVCLFRIDPAV
jgi:hypothetical protein